MSTGGEPAAQAGHDLLLHDARFSAEPIPELEFDQVKPSDIGDEGGKSNQ